MKSYLGNGFSAGRIIVESDSRADAWEQIQQIEWSAACSCGNHPDPGKEDDVIEVPRFIGVYAIRNNNDGHPSYIYRKRTGIGSWEYFTTPEMAFAHALSLGMSVERFHPLTVKFEI